MKKKTKADSIEVVYPSAYIFDLSYPSTSEDWTDEFPATIKTESSAGKTQAEIKKIERSKKLMKDMVEILKRVQTNKGEENLVQAKGILEDHKDFIEGLREYIKDRIPTKMKGKLRFPVPREEGGFGLFWRINILETIWLQSICFSLQAKEEYDAKIREILRYYKLSNIWDPFIRILVWFGDVLLTKEKLLGVDVPNGLPIVF